MKLKEVRAMVKHGGSLNFALIHKSLSEKVKRKEGEMRSRPASTIIDLFETYQRECLRLLYEIDDIVEGRNHKKLIQKMKVDSVLWNDFYSADDSFFYIALLQTEQGLRRKFGKVIFNFLNHSRWHCSTTVQELFEHLKLEADHQSVTGATIDKMGIISHQSIEKGAIEFTNNFEAQEGGKAIFVWEGHCHEYTCFNLNTIDCGMVTAFIFRLTSSFTIF